MNAAFEAIKRDLASGRIAEARASCELCLKADPDDAAAMRLMGAVCASSKDLVGAIGWWTRCAERTPEVAGIHYDLGVALAQTGRGKDAVDGFRRATELAPASFPFTMRLTEELGRESRYVEAEGMARRALSLRPSSIDARRLLADALREQNRRAEALAILLEVIRLGPMQPELPMSAAASLCEEIGGMKDAVKWHLEAAKAAPARSFLQSNYLYSLRYLEEDADPEAVFRAHISWARHAARLIPTNMPRPRNDPDPDRRLRIAYVSADFCRHSNSNGIEPLVQNHDHSKWEVWCYSDSPKSDEVTERFRAAVDEWRDVRALDDESLARVVQEDGIDVLVDHTGHMGGNRMLVFARRPVPVQVTFPGYPGTTGLDTFDAFITDEHQDPSGKTERFYTERLIRLRGSPRCYRALTGAPPASPLPADSNAGQLTFAVVQRPSKVTDRMLGIWSQILNSLPQSRLLILLSAALSKDLAQAFGPRLKERGIPAERVTLVERQPMKSYYTLFHRIDVVLDTQPYAGCNTTMDSLWMGVPVVTMAGRTYVSRVGVSILAQLGLEKEWVAEHDEQYVDIAVRAAADLPRLRELRATLRQRMVDSPLLDGKRVTSEFEAACRSLWKEWCAKQAAAKAGV